MSSVLNSDEQQCCKDCEYCYPIIDTDKLMCAMRSQETKATNLCKDYDYTEGNYYAGA